LTALATLAVALGSAAGASADPGSLDTSFNGTGIVNLPSGSQLFGVATQSNGEIVAVGRSGSSVLVRRYTTGGALDAQYVGPSGTARGVAVQPDGKIVIAGTSGGAMLVERLTTSLTPDSSFGSGGVATAFGGQNGVANAVAVGPDGSIVAAGSVNGGNTRVGVARFSSSGATVWATVPGFDNYSVINGVAIQPDGKIVFVGSQAPSLSTDGLIGRLNPDGSLDSSFAGGVYTYHYPGGGYTSLNAVTIQNNGQIVAAGVDAGGPNAIFVRINLNGSFDQGFGSGGVAAMTAQQNTNSQVGYIGAYGVGIAGGGRIVGDGNFVDSNTVVDAAAWALTPGGSPETTFGTNGRVTTPSNGYEACALSIAPDGSLVSVGNTVATVPDYSPCQVNGSAASFVARYIGYGPPPPPPPPPPPVTTTAPIVTTGAASSLAQSSAAIAGQINPGGLQTSYHFKYGTSTSYGSSSPTATLPAGASAVAVSAQLSGLQAGTTYHYQLVASNADGTVAGADRTFTTAKAPVVPRLKLTLSGLLRSYSIATVEKRGLTVHVRCSRPCSIKGSLLISAANAKRLRLGTRRLAIANGTASLKRGGSGRVVLHLTAKAAKAIKKLKQLGVTLSLVATPSSGGPRASVSKPLTLKR
jgi:uncharacterized delta-60 repeat protein